MDNQKSSSVSTLLPKSKKIQKPSSQTGKRVSESQNGSHQRKKYTTFTKDTKRRVLTDLQRAFALHFKIQFDGELDDVILLETINDVTINKFNEYHAILKTILQRTIAGFVDSPAEMTLWRKRIKTWIPNIEKPETRGGLVIPNEKKIEFDSGLKEILLSLPARIFPLFREKVLILLSELLQTEVDSTTCSKHWWFNYQNRNPELKFLWKKLDLERVMNKKMRMDISAKSTEPSPTQETQFSPLFSPLFGEVPFLGQVSPSPFYQPPTELENFNNLASTEPFLAKYAQFTPSPILEERLFSLSENFDIDCLPVLQTPKYEYCQPSFSDSFGLTDYKWNFSLDSPSDASKYLFEALPLAGFDI